MGGEACPAEGFGTRSFKPGWFPDRPRDGIESLLGFMFTTWTFKIWRKSCTKASFSHLPLPDFEGSLARKLHFHIFNFHFLKEVLHESFVFIFNNHILREVSHESFVLTYSTFRFWRKSRTKASFSLLELSKFEGSLARKRRFHIFHFQILRGVSHESFIFTSSTFTFWRKYRTKASFSHL